jgi:hypothetical protein
MKRLALLAVPAVVAAGVGLSSASAAPKPFKLVESDLQLSVVDLPPASDSENAPPSRGDMVVFTKKLSIPGGKPAGRLHVRCAVTEPRSSIETAIFECTGAYVLRDGQLSIALTAPIGGSENHRIAVTGGTGAYAGARGEIVTRGADDTVHIRTSRGA